jgi:hypothetical protein
MFDPLNHPFLVLVVLIVVFWFAAWIGAWFRANHQDPDEESRHDFLFVVGGTLTLLGLLIGFTFSMAVSRYDQRKNYEAQEANAIGAEYTRADLLSAADASKVRSLLNGYLDQRILAYNAATEEQFRRYDVRTAQLQSELWSTISQASTGQPSPTRVFILEGMDAVLTAQGYARAAWQNRIPVAAWILLVAISLFCNLLVGCGVRGGGVLRLYILPVALSISLFLIVDIDSPYRGFIHVPPENLEILADYLHSPRPGMSDQHFPQGVQCWARVQRNVFPGIVQR